ncbi:MAG TPA: hypothetical protein VK910_05360 [Thiobacillus sp.]|nr:hypothetical protein [Thiobacillus sp.]
MPQTNSQSRIDEVVAATTKRYLAILSAHLRSADGTRFHLTDLVIFGLINRNLGLLRAMPALVKERNIHALAPLLRVQLDGLLRLNAFRIVGSMDDLAKHVISGNSLRKFKDQDGQFLTDSNLVKLLKSEASWVEPMYETLSGWVHFSESHIFSTASPGSTDGSFVLAVGEMESIPDQLFIEATDAIEAMHSATAELIENYFKRLTGA